MLNRIREAKKNEHGFTLIELLIVIVILGILAAIVVFSVAGITDRGKTSACKADVETVLVAGEAYIAGPPPLGNGVSATDMTALMTAGLLHSVPTATVTYNKTGASTFTAVGIGC
jgi:prepilin-type N-terminal cleavage/methylation domain-containing protein